MACRNKACDYCQMRDEYEEKHLCRFCDLPATKPLIGWAQFTHDYACQTHAVNPRAGVYYQMEQVRAYRKTNKLARK